jgi:hypothetical protein
VLVAGDDRCVGQELAPLLDDTLGVQLGRGAHPQASGSGARL